MRTLGTSHSFILGSDLKNDLNEPRITSKPRIKSTDGRIYKVASSSGGPGGSRLAGRWFFILLLCVLLAIEELIGYFLLPRTKSISLLILPFHAKYRVCRCGDKLAFEVPRAIGCTPL